MGNLISLLALFLPMTLHSCGRVQLSFWQYEHFSGWTMVGVLALTLVLTWRRDNRAAFWLAVLSVFVFVGQTLPLFRMASIRFLEGYWLFFVGQAMILASLSGVALSHPSLEVVPGIVGHSLVAPLPDSVSSLTATPESPVRRNGFTLIEIMIVILIIGVLTTLASFSYRSLRQRVHRVSCRENLRILQQAAILCQTEHPEFDNTDLTPGRLFQLGYLKKVLRCPTGGQYAITQEKGEIAASCFKTTDGTDHGLYK